MRSLILKMIEFLKWKQYPMVVLQTCNPFQDLVHYMDVIWGPEQIHVVSLQLHGMSVHRIIGYGNKVVGGYPKRLDLYGSQYSCFIVDRNQKCYDDGCSSCRKPPKRRFGAFSRDGYMGSGSMGAWLKSRF